MPRVEATTVVPGLSRAEDVEATTVVQATTVVPGFSRAEDARRRA